MLSFSEAEVNAVWTIGELVTIIFWHCFLKIFGTTDTLKDFILLNIQTVRGLVQSEVINILDVVKETKRLSLFRFTCNVKCHIYLFTKIYLYFFVRRGGLQIAVDSTECSVDNSDLFSWHKIYHSIEPRHP